MMLLAVIGWSEIYLTCLLVGLVFAVITGLLSGMGGHHGGFHGHEVGGHDVGGQHVDGSHEHPMGDGQSGTSALADPSIHFSPLSPVVLAMFVTTFGGTGLLAEHGLHLPWLVHLSAATFSGLLFGGITFYAFARLVAWAQGYSQSSVMEALGLAAEVIVPIPEKGTGQIAYILRERRCTAPARSEDGQAIAGHASVTIVDIPGPTMVVRESDEERLRKLS